MTHERRYSRLQFPTISTLTVEGAPAGQPGAATPTAMETHLIDISLKGALVERPAALDAPVGTALTLLVRIEDSPVEITMNGTVAHVSSERVGLHCTSIDMESMTHLRRLMELNLGDAGLLDRELLALG